MAIKIGVDTISPLSLTAGRVLIAAIILYAVASFLGYKLPMEARFWVYCFVLGVLGHGLPFSLINWGQEQVNSGQAAILMAVMPMVTIVLAHFFNVGDRITLAKVTSVVFGFSGVIILVGPEALKGLGGDFWRQLAISCGAVCYALAAIIIRNMPSFPLITRSAGVLIASTGCNNGLFANDTVAVYFLGAVVAVSDYPVTGHELYAFVTLVVYSDGIGKQVPIFFGTGVAADVVGGHVNTNSRCC